MWNNVVLLGEGPLFWEVRDYLGDYHVQVHALDQDLPSDIHAVVDIEMVDEKKKESLCIVENRVSTSVPIFTSSLYRTATEIASWLKYPDRVLGFSPILFYKMRRLEVSLPLQYNKKELHQHLLFWKEMDKEIEIVGDEPGLVFPRIVSLLVNEAVFALSEGIAQKEDIDLAMKKGTNYPYGPFEWADDIGIDVILTILSGLYRELGEEKYRAAPLLRKMSYAGYFGQASGKGFYSYQRTSSLVEW